MLPCGYLVLGRPRRLELYLPKTQDDTVTETLGERWNYDVGRHSCRCKIVSETIMQNSHGTKWEDIFIYAPAHSIDTAEGFTDDR